MRLASWALTSIHLGSFSLLQQRPHPSQFSGIRTIRSTHTSSQRVAYQRTAAQGPIYPVVNQEPSPQLPGTPGLLEHPTNFRPPPWNILLIFATFHATLRKAGMPRKNRAFSDNTIYEIVSRTRDSLPMPPNQTSNELKLGILGRTQRDSKVEPRPSGTPYLFPQLFVPLSEKRVCHERIAPSQTILSTRSFPGRGTAFPCLQTKPPMSSSSEYLDELSETVRLSSVTLST
jgi:hypothetical protein